MERQKPTAENQLEAQIPTRISHAHRWRIEEVGGPISTGHCGNCGSHKEFRNFLSEQDIWNTDNRAKA